MKVNLGGQGADEIFGGYHKHIYLYLRSLIIRGKIYIRSKDQFIDILPNSICMRNFNLN